MLVNVATQCLFEPLVAHQSISTMLVRWLWFLCMFSHTQDSRMPGLSTKLASLFCDSIESAIISTLPTHESPFLKGNFAPVQESGPLHIRTTGDLPDCLNGQLVYVGPNPKFRPVAGYQWIDGDGMLHGVRIKNGRGTYVSRYVKTARLLQEERYGASKFFKVGDMKGDWQGFLLILVYCLRLCFRLLDGSKGIGTGNTGLLYHNRRLMALHETDKPYVIQISEDGNFETVSRLDYDKSLVHSFTAHPKVDPITGELFFFGYHLRLPSATYRVVSKEGVIRAPVSIRLSNAVVMHDFAITENYAIFMDLPMILREANLLQRKPLFTFDSSKSARFGVLPRYATSDYAIRWFDLPSCYIFHTANAWEDGDEVVLLACRMPESNFDLDMIMERKKGFAGELYEFRFNLRSGGASQKQLSPCHVEFPCINQRYLGRKQRYIYTCLFDEPFKSRGLAKFDLQKGHERLMPSKFLYGPNRYGSEPVFIPKSQAKDIDEDDGYLISFVHDEALGKSEVVVVDAKTMNYTPVAVISLPFRVPYGFHGIFVNEEQLEESIQCRDPMSLYPKLGFGID